MLCARIVSEGAVQAYAWRLQECAKTKSLLEGRRLHARIREEQLVPYNRFLSNLLVQMYGSCGSMEEAMAVFEAMGNTRNVYTWNILLAAYAHNGHLREASAAFAGMDRRDVVSWTTMVKAYAASGVVDKARGMFDTMPQRDAVAWNALLHAVTQYGDLLDASVLFREMPQRTVVSWTVMLASAARDGDLELGRETFERMPRWDSVSWNALTSANAQAGHLQSAIEMFDASPDRDAASWNGMIQAYIAAGEGRRAVEMLMLMDLEGARPSAISHAIAMGGVEDVAMAKAIHRSAAELGLECGGAAIIQMYSRCSRPDLSRASFDEMARRDITSWTALLAAMVAPPPPSSIDEVKMVFDKMPQWDAMASNFAIKSLLGQMRDEAMAIFEAMEERNAASWLIVFHAHAAEGRVEEAKRIFDAMPSSGSSPCRDAACWTSMLTAVSASLDKARSVFDRMPQRDAAGWNAMVHALGESGRVAKARDMVFERHPEPSAVTFCSLIQALTRAGQGRQGIRLFAAMDLEGIPADEVAFITALEACGSAAAAALREGKLIHEEILSSTCSPQPTTSTTSVSTSSKLATALIDMYGKCGDISTAMLAFNTMNVNSRDGVAWNVTIAAAAAQGQGSIALSRLAAMSLEGVEADALTFAKLLLSFGHAGMCEAGRLAMATMAGDYGVQPGAAHYMAMTTILCRGGRLDDAEELLDSMPFEPELEAWTIFVACARGGGSQAAHRAAMAAVDADPDNPASYVLLSQMHRAAPLSLLKP